MLYVFSQHMRTINKKRADLLIPIFRKPQNEDEEEQRMIHGLDCQLTVNSLVSQLLRATFSYKEERECSGCTHKNSRTLPTLMANQSLRPDFTNLSEAVLANFSDPVCELCNNTLNISATEFGQCIFIEVRFLFFIYKKLIDKLADALINSDLFHTGFQRTSHKIGQSSRSNDNF